MDGLIAMFADVGEALPAVAKYGWLGALQLYIMFLAGQGLHILRRASAAIQSAGNPIQTRKEFVKKYYSDILWRGALALVAFWGWINNPDIVQKYVGLNFTLPVGGGTALLFGMASDLILDWASQKLPEKYRRFIVSSDKEIPATTGEAVVRVVEAVQSDKVAEPVTKKP